MDELTAMSPVPPSAMAICSLDFLKEGFSFTRRTYTTFIGFMSYTTKGQYYENIH